MDMKFKNLTTQDVPSGLDAKILAASRLAAHGYARRRRIRKISYLTGAVAASLAAGFAIFAPPAIQSNAYEVKYQALNDLSLIEQEAYALDAELNCNALYTLSSTATMELLP